MKTNELNQITKAVYNIAKENEDGFTYNIVTNAMQTNGYAVARKETQNSFGQDGLQAAIIFALLNKVTCIGGWKDSQSGLYYFDATDIYDDLQSAMDAAKENEQLAIFDMNNMQEIRL